MIILQSASSTGSFNAMTPGMAALASYHGKLFWCNIIDSQQHSHADGVLLDPSSLGARRAHCGLKTIMLCPSDKGRLSPQDKETMLSHAMVIWLM